MYQTIHSSSQRGDSRVDGAICEIRYEDINHYSLFNYGESVDGDGISGYRYHTRPYTSHHSGDIGISSGFYGYGNDISGHRYQTRHFFSYNHGGLNIAHPIFSQEYIPRGVQGENQHKNHPYYSYPIMTPHSHPIMT